MHSCVSQLCCIVLIDWMWGIGPHSPAVCVIGLKGQGKFRKHHSSDVVRVCIVYCVCVSCSSGRDRSIILSFIDTKAGSKGIPCFPLLLPFIFPELYVK